MRVHSLKHLSDSDLLQHLNAIVSRDRTITASLLAHIEEADARRLYATAGYPSMYSYCVDGLGLSEDAAYKRIQAARTARRFPAILEAIADGRVHLAGVCLIAPHLTDLNFDEMLALAAGRRKSEIEVALARRLSRLAKSVLASEAAGDRGWPARAAVAAPSAAPSAAMVRPVPSSDDASPSTKSQTMLQQGVVQIELAPGQVEVAPVPEESYLLQIRLGASLHAKLRYAQDLLSHAVPNGDLVHVLDRALDALVAKLEKQKFAAARRECASANHIAADGAHGAGGARPPSRSSSGDRARHIPAYVKRAVWERDGSRCTFVSDSGRRCDARRFLEFDHVEPVARGGRATIEGLRLRCRTHNQLEAERAFGAEFMAAKRTAALPERADPSVTATGTNRVPSASPVIPTQSAPRSSPITGA